MKFLVVVSTLLLVANALEKEFLEKVMIEIQKVAQQCVEKIDATSNDMAELMAHKLPPSTHEAKCVIACFYKHYKIMKDDGTFDKDAAIKAFDELKDQDADLHGKIMKLIDVCVAKDHSNDDHCESATSMAVCVKEEAEGLGISKEAFLVNENK